jgi:hypothetical protein
MKNHFTILTITIISLLPLGCNDVSDNSNEKGCALNDAKGETYLCLTGLKADSDCSDNNGTVVEDCPSNALISCRSTNGYIYYYEKDTVEMMRLMSPDDPCAVSDINKTK